MNFNSLAFLIFLPITVGVYWLAPKKLQQLWLLACSYFFYMYANPALIVLLLVSTFIDYFCSNGIEARRDSSRLKKTFLTISMLANLGLLFTFKYFDFFAQNINALCAALSLSYQVPELGLILPVGISFYTFQTMSYTIDVYRGDFHAEKNPVTFALYVTFFPQLVAGPIESPRNLLPQLRQEHRFRYGDFSAGMRLLLCGFFRKCAVADLCGIFVNRVFAAPGEANALAIACASGLFCIQMYCDFAGYSEIAAGAARLMGIRLMRNFDRPYLSQSYSEFFRRWHISLNQWFTSYVYIPLGGSRKGLAVKLRNTLIVFTLCGLWHGARWTYVLWGLYAALWVCLESIILKPMENAAKHHGIDLKNPGVKLFRRFYMFLIFIPAALLFRADDIAQAGILLSRLFTQWGLSTAYFESTFASLGLTASSLVQLVLCITAMAKLYVWGLYDLRPAQSQWGSRRRLSCAVYLILIITMSALALLATQDAAGFAYFQF